MGNKLGVGRRGAGGEASAAEIWGVSRDEYLQKADPWPLNPHGELLLGLKIENRRALEDVELSTSIPGIAFAEWGQGDMHMSFGYPSANLDPRPPEVQAARDRVFAACQAGGLRFLEGFTAETAAQKIDDGNRICGVGGPEGAATAAAGRAYTNRTMPV